MRIFGPKKKEKTVEEKRKPTGLEIICGEDKEAFQALSGTIFLTPQKMTETMREAAEKAEESLKKGNFANAHQYYLIAGGLAIFQGNAKKVREFYGALEKLTGVSYPIIREELTQRALDKAREYYTKYPDGEKEEKKEEKK